MKVAEKLKRDVYSLALPEGRMVGTEGHKVAERFVESRMSEIGLEPYSGDSFALPFSSMSEDFTNYVGVVRSNHPDRAPLFIGAHYDSVIAAPCADDNAAAVAIALAAGERFAANAEALERDVVVAIFDSEEPPYFHSELMGSEWFYKHQMDGRGAHAALVMDLVGHDVVIPSEMIKGIGGVFSNLPFLGGGKDLALPMIKDLFFVMGGESAPEMPGVFESVGDPRGLRVVKTLNRYVGDMSDHGVFRRNGVPYLFFSCGIWPHYHMPSDTPDKLNYGKMERILNYLVDLAGEMSATDLTRDAAETFDTAKMEADSLKKACSPLTLAIMRAVGLERLETREDIERVVELLRSIGLC